MRSPQATAVMAMVLLSIFISVVAVSEVSSYLANSCLTKYTTNPDSVTLAIPRPESHFEDFEWPSLSAKNGAPVGKLDKALSNLTIVLDCKKLNISINYTEMPTTSVKVICVEDYVVGFPTASAKTIVNDGGFHSEKATNRSLSQQLVHIDFYSFYWFLRRTFLDVRLIYSYVVVSYIACVLVRVFFPSQQIINMANMVLEAENVVVECFCALINAFDLYVYRTILWLGMHHITDWLTVCLRLPTWAMLRCLYWIINSFVNWQLTLLSLRAMLFLVRTWAAWIVCLNRMYHSRFFFVFFLFAPVVSFAFGIYGLCGYIYISTSGHRIRIQRYLSFQSMESIDAVEREASLPSEWIERIRGCLRQMDSSNPQHEEFTQLFSNYFYYALHDQNMTWEASEFETTWEMAEDDQRNTYVRMRLKFVWNTDGDVFDFISPYYMRENASDSNACLEAMRSVMRAHQAEVRFRECFHDLVFQGKFAGMYCMFGIKENPVYDFIEELFIFVFGIIHAKNWESYVACTTHLVRWFVRAWPADPTAATANIREFIIDRVSNVYRCALTGELIKDRPVYVGLDALDLKVWQTERLSQSLIENVDALEGLNFQSQFGGNAFDSLTGFVKHPLAKSILSIVVCCGAAVMYSGGKWDLTSVLSVEKNFEKFVMNPASFVDTLVSSLRYLVYAGKEAYFGRFFQIFSTREGIDHWFSEVDFLYTVSERYNLLSDLDDNDGSGRKLNYYSYHARLSDAEKVANDFLSKADSPAAKASIRYAVTKLKKIRIVVNSAAELNSDRKVPFGVLLNGDAGIGKTSVETMLFKFFSEQFGLPYGDNYKYNYPFGSEFMDGYMTSMWCIVMEDIARMDISKNPTGDETLKVLLDLAASNPVIANMAAVELKGVVAVRPRLIIGTTNTKSLNASTYFNCPMAIARRLRWVVTPTVKAEYAMQDGRMDSTKVPAAVEGEFQDLWTFTVEEPVEVRRAGHKGEVKYEVRLKDASLKDFLLFIGQKMHDFDLAEDRRLKNEGMMKGIAFCNGAGVKMPCSLCTCDACAARNDAQQHLNVPVVPASDGAVLIQENMRPGIRQGVLNASRFVSAQAMAVVGALMQAQPAQAAIDDYIPSYSILPWILWSFIIMIFFHQMCYVAIYAYRTVFRMNAIRSLMNNCAVGLTIVYTDYLNMLYNIAAVPFTISGWIYNMFQTMGTYIFIALGVIVGRIASRECARRVYLRASNASPMEKALLALLAVGTAAIILKTFFGAVDRKDMHNQGLFDIGTAPVQRGVEKYNPWFGSVFIQPCDILKLGEGSKCHKGPNAQHALRNVLANCIVIQFLRIRNENGDIVREFPDGATIRGVGIKSNIFMVNKHCVPEGCQLEAQIITGSGGAYTAGTKLLINDSHIWRNPTKDFILLKIEPSASVRDITTFFTYRGHNAKARASLLRQINASMSTENIHFEEGVKMLPNSMFKDNTVSDAWSGYPAEHTQPGDCGSVLWDHANAAILGIHSMGSKAPYKPYAVSVAIYREDIDEGMAALEKQVLDSIKRSVDKISTSVLGFQSVKVLLQKVVSVFPSFDVSANDDLNLIDERGEEIPLSGALHPKCPADDRFYTQDKADPNYVEQGRLVRYGMLGVNRSSYKSQVKDTPMKDIAAKHGLISDKVQPLLNDWLPKRRALVDMTHQYGLIDQDVLNMIVVIFAAEILSVLQGETLHMYDLYTAVNGAAGVTYVDKMNFNTSMGFPWLTKKTKFLESSEPRGGHVQAFKPVAHVIARADRIVDKYRHKIRANPIFNCQLKDEPVSPEKRRIGKTRMFVCSPFDFSLVVRMALLPFIRLVQNNRFLFESGPGTVCQGKEWGELRDYLCEFGEDRFIAGDYKNFDKNMHCVWMLAAFRFIFILCACLGMTDAELEIIAGIAIDVSFCHINFFGDLMMLFGSNPSGWPLTVIINGIVNCLYIRYAYYQCNPAKETISFKSNVKLMTYGDDNTMGVSDRVPWFTHTSIQRELKKVGVLYTMADKSEGSRPYINFNEVSFLKRMWVKDNFRGVEAWKCPLELESIAKMVCVWVRSKTITEEDQVISVLQSAAYESFWHGKEYFDTFHVFINDVLDTLKLRNWCTTSTFPSYEGYVDRWFNCSGMVGEQRWDLYLTDEECL